MAQGKVTAIVPASSAAVFDLLHDYDRRLEWDILLRAAYLDDGFTEAKQGATSVCAGRWLLGGFALKTIYVTFERPKVAAVKLVNRPPFFDTWAASILHEEITPGTSRITYTYTFTAKPRWPRFALEPLMARIFAWEIRKRLRALAAYFGKTVVSSTTTAAG